MHAEKIMEGIAVVTQTPRDELQIASSTDLIEEVGLTSIQIMNLIFHLESEFDIIFDDDSLDLINFTSVERIEKTVQGML